MGFMLGMILLILCGITAGDDGQDVCAMECSARGLSNERGFDINCNNACRMKQCQYGCKKWQENHNQMCHNICQSKTNFYRIGQSKTNFYRDGMLYCIIGCNLAITTYIENLKKKIGTPSSPYLVAEPTNDTITIQWNTAIYDNISFLVQWRYDSPPNSWEYYQPEFPLKSNRIQITGLHPYVKYRFRIAWILLPQYTPILSSESNAISTLPYGAPTSMPTITRTAANPTHISVSWIPPRFSNGPILSYVLYLREFSNDSKVSVKDIAQRFGGLYYMFTNLKPQTIYNISITTSNKFGEGPAYVKFIKTLPLRENLVIPSFQPFLILADGRKLLKKKLNIVDEPEIIYQYTSPYIIIKGVAVHIKKELIFISDSSGSIYSIPVHKTSDMSVIINRRRTYPETLSMDWLNNKLYMVEETQISRCDMKGNNNEVIVKGFRKRPLAMLVDPYHGFLYWTYTDTTTSGLYKIDLGLTGMYPISLEDTQIIYKNKTFTSFTIDYINFRFMIPIAENNTIASVSLDGVDEINIRNNSQQPQFQNVRSLVYYNNLFFWESGHSVFYEQYHQKEDRYYHNAYLLNGGPFSHLNIFHPDLQPFPVPLDPVENIQAIFSEEIGKISWQKPKLLGVLGKGAWEDWRYEVKLVDHTSGLFKIETNVSSTSYTFHNLYANTLYSVKVQAFSRGGRGPWSADFYGKTLKPSTSTGYPYIVWNRGGEIVTTDLLGENIKLLLPISYLSQIHVTEINWHNSLLFLTTNTSSVYVHNMETKSLSLIPNITNVASIAVDWITPKLYWSSPMKQMISRANLDGSQPEHLPIVTVTKELVIDSLAAYLYWSTAYSVEFSRLNGMQHEVYFQTGLFSGKYGGSSMCIGSICYKLDETRVKIVRGTSATEETRQAVKHLEKALAIPSDQQSWHQKLVIGLVIDYDSHYIYWTVRSFEGSVLYRAPLANRIEDVAEKYVEFVKSLAEHDVQGPLGFYSERLFWLRDEQKAFISNMTGQNMAQIKGLDRLQMLVVVDPSLHPLPGGTRRKSINVIPRQIQEHHIIIKGAWNKFNITWNYENSVTFGTVFYEMKVETEWKTYSLVTEQTYYTFPSEIKIPPYTPLRIAIKVFTFWASSQQTVTTLHSPMSVPSQPTHPRVFISYKRSPLQSNYEINFELRWQPPAQHNGIILGYGVDCWFHHEGLSIPVFTDKLINGSVQKFQDKDLFPNMTYNFQVYAYNAVGNGPPSEIVKIDTSVETPVPKLLLAKTDSVQVNDIDNQEELLLTNKISHPIDVAYLSREEKVFWIEENNSLMSSTINGSNTILIQNLPHKSTSLTANWVTRKLYWTQIEKQSGSIWMLDLNYNSEPQCIVNKSSTIAAVEVEPFSGHLFWTVVDTNEVGQLMVSDTSGKSVRPFFAVANDYLYYNQHKRQRRATELDRNICNCPLAPKVGRAIAIDYSEVNQPKIIWVKGEQGHIWSSDIHACTCFALINSSKFRDIGLPPTSITVDKNKLYWSNSDKHRVYSITKKPVAITSTDNAAHPFHYYDITSEIVGNVRGIRAVADSLQPLPDAKCLFPKSYGEIPVLNSSTASSLTLELKTIIFPASCHNISTSSILYTVYYKKFNSKGPPCEKDSQNCTKIKTYNTVIIVDGLIPFTNYSIQVSVRNFYSKDEELFGPVALFQTKEGAPTAPRNIRAITASPDQVDVFWEPPKISNGGSLLYELRWRSDIDNKTRSVNHILSNEEYQTSLKHLAPKTKHYIMVRAYSSGGDMLSDSYEVTAVTYELPGDLILLDSNPTLLILQWRASDNIEMHELEVTKIETNEKISVQKEKTRPNTIYNFTINSLLPRTSYAVRIILTYFPHTTIYIHPKDGKGFIFQTIGTKPNVPGVPFIRHFGKGVYQVEWEGVKSVQGELLTYILQFRTVGNDAIKSSEWTNILTTPNTQWLVQDLPVKATYTFRVSTSNEYGTSNYSSPSAELFLPESTGFLEPEDEEMAIILASILAAVILIVVFLIVGICIAKSKDKKKTTVLQINSNSPHVELATLQELPHHGNFVHENNELYGLGETPQNDELLGSTQIRREQIVLTKFLGSGAFGEVFEGIAHELYGEGTPPTRVAVKTLRKGATEQEKTGFLKEAKLMSNFNHSHILKLLGVCLDNHLNFIILELMEGGDLLSYLRSNRPTVKNPSPLTIHDLMTICVHVASGCKYLEEMHFVHRDLAARNCLVSGHDSATRAVKIGDFGLARDVYKNDYYRKEGEGLLPVRWLPPESLIDGVFTTQSDIWAFGVLLWEVMTLGQQPYPARGNLEVLHYVREGGHLDKPTNCPENLYQLMLLCWNYNPLDRPAFSYCLQKLIELRQTTTNRMIPFNSVHNHTYCSSVTTDDDSSSVLIRENYVDVELSSSYTPSLENNIRHRNANRKNRRRRILSAENTSNENRTGLECGIWHTSSPQINVPSEETVKYLEILPDHGDSSDGYEIPLRLQLKNKQSYGQLNRNCPRYSKDSSSATSEYSDL